MLDDYIDGQPVAYDILTKAIKSKKIAHAYLFYSDNADVAFNFAFCYAKTLLCPDNHLIYTACNNCSICHRIDNNNFPEFKIISPDGLWIK
jgi:DNA polymerase-3 subunit delta'